MPPQPSLAVKIKKTKPTAKIIEHHFTLKHADFGDLELDICLDENNIVLRVMRTLLKTKSFKASAFGGSIIAELSEHSATRVKALRRLRNKP